VPRFEEGRLAFIFGDRWQHVIAFDQETDYENAANALPETKGVDFVGLISDSLFLIEVKDFRQHQIENRERLRKGELSREVGKKVRDSIACIVGFCCSSSQREKWQPFLDGLLRLDQPIQIILWLEQDLPRPVPQRSRVKDNIKGNELKTLLKWLHVRANVQRMSDWNPDRLDLVVESLPFQEI
jgi:hypothetical protein